MLEVVGLEGMEKRLPSELSGGQMQRVAVARSLAPNPAVLLFDEPLSNLDAKLRESMRFELRRIQKEVGTTAIYVTHDQAEAMVISDRIILMSKGAIMQEGTAKDLYERPTTSFAAKFLGFSNLLPARVESAADADGMGSLRVDGFGGTTVSGVVGKGMRAGDEVTISIRPEAIHVEPRGAGSHRDGVITLPGTVSDLVYAGNLCDAFVDISGTQLRAQLLPIELSQLSVGDQVNAVFDARSVWTVAEQTHPDTAQPNEAENAVSPAETLHPTAV